MGRTTRQRAAQRAFAAAEVYGHFARIAGGALGLLDSLGQLADIALSAAAGDRAPLTADELAAARRVLREIAWQAAPLRSELDTITATLGHIKTIV